MTRAEGGFLEVCMGCRAAMAAILLAHVAWLYHNRHFVNTQRHFMHLGHLPLGLVAGWSESRG